MSTPAAITARGTVLRASTISSPIVDALSTPPKAKAIVDRKRRSFSPVPGTSELAVIGVAGPYFVHEYSPNAIRSAMGIQPAMAPALLSHFPTFRPTTLSRTAIARPTTDTAMKYRGFAPYAWAADGPATYSALAPAKYSSPGK